MTNTTNDCDCGDTYCDLCNPFLIIEAQFEFKGSEDNVEIILDTTRGLRSIFVSTAKGGLDPKVELGWNPGLIF